VITCTRKGEGRNPLRWAQAALNLHQLLEQGGDCSGMRLLLLAGLGGSLCLRCVHQPTLDVETSMLGQGGLAMVAYACPMTPASRRTDGHAAPVTAAVTGG
jgi:hypothetical protein